MCPSFSQNCPDPDSCGKRDGEIWREKSFPHDSTLRTTCDTDTFRLLLRCILGDSNNSVLLFWLKREESPRCIFWHKAHTIVIPITYCRNLYYFDGISDSLMKIRRHDQNARKKTWKEQSDESNSSDALIFLSIAKSKILLLMVINRHLFRH